MKRIATSCPVSTRLLLVLLVLSLAVGGTFTSEARAAEQTFYVDSETGDDADDGLTPETAWRTMERVKNSAPAAGDSVLLKRGGFWREQLTIPRSGVEGNPITFGAYGDGDAPVLCGSDIVQGWTAAGDGRWSAALADEPRQVLVDGVRGKQEDALAGLDAAGEWFWANGTLTLVSEADPDGYSEPGVEAAVRSGVFGWEKNDILVRDLAVVRGKYGLYVRKCTRVVVETVQAEANAYDGLMADGVETSAVTFRNCISKNNGRHGAMANDATDVTVEGGEFSGNAAVYGAGVGMNGTTGGKITGVSVHDNFYGLKVSDATGAVIEKSESFDNADFGIDLDIGSKQITVTGNKVHDNGSHGICTEWNSSNCIVVRNRVWSNGETHAGIFVEKATDITVAYNIVTDEYVTLWINGTAARVKAHNNTLSRASSTGVLLRDDVSSVELKNNVATDCSYKAVYVNAGCTDGFVADNNDWFAADGRFKWDGTTYDFAGWQQASGQDAQSINADPKLVNAADGDFNLQDGSPCVDAGADVGLETDFDGTAVPQGDAPDIGAQERPAEAPEPEPANVAPNAEAGADQIIVPGGIAPLDGSASSDADGVIVTYEWDLDADGVYDVADCVTDCTFWSVGTYTVNLRVTDDDGATATDFLVVTVQEEDVPPPAELTIVHVSGVEIAAERRRKRITADGYVTIVDASGAAVEGATVAVVWSLDGRRSTDNAVTDGGGVATSTLRDRGGSGSLLTLTVTDVTLEGATYDPDCNIDSSARLVVQ